MDNQRLISFGSIDVSPPFGHRPSSRSLLHAASVHEVVDVARTLGRLRVSLMSSIDTSSVCAFRWPISICSCGLSSRPLWLTRVKELFFPASSMSLSYVCGYQHVMACYGVISQFYINPGGAAQTANCQRASGEDAGFFNLVKCFCRPFNNGERRTGSRIARALVLSGQTCARRFDHSR